MTFVGNLNRTLDYHRISNMEAHSHFFPQFILYVTIFINKYLNKCHIFDVYFILYDIYYQIYKYDL